MKLFGKKETKKETVNNDKVKVTKSYVCDVLGIPFDGEDETYSRIAFATEAPANSLAVIMRRRWDPHEVLDSKITNWLAKKAIGKGAKCLLTTEQIEDYPCLIVEEPIFESVVKLMKSISSQYESMKAVTITGSIGKTTTTNMVQEVVRVKYPELMDNRGKNVNEYCDVVRRLQKLTFGTQAYVQELSEHRYKLPGDMARMFPSDAAIVTLIGSSHIERLGSQEKILETCLSSEYGLKEGGTLILNGDDSLQAAALPEHKPVYYGIDNEKADYRAANIIDRFGIIEFDVLYDDQSAHVLINCFGKHNVYNALAAFAAGKALEMKDEEIARGLANYKTEGVRQNVVRLQDKLIFLDCYNSSMESVESSMKVLSGIETDEVKRKIAVLGDVKEIGETSAEYHAEIGRIVAEADCDVVLFFGEESKNAYDAYIKIKDNAYHFLESEDLVAKIKEIEKPGDMFLFKASSSIHLEWIADEAWGSWFSEEHDSTDENIVERKNVKYRIYETHATVIGQVGENESLRIRRGVEKHPVTGIEERAFYGCKKLKHVRLPETLRNIRKEAFAKTKVKKVTIPAGVQLIADNAFKKRTKFECEDSNIQDKFYKA